MTTLLEPRRPFTAPVDRMLPPPAWGATTLTLPLPIVSTPEYSVLDVLDRLGRRIRNAFDCLRHSVEQTSALHRREMEEGADQLRQRVVTDFATEQYALDMLFADLRLTEPSKRRRWFR